MLIAVFYYFCYACFYRHLQAGCPSGLLILCTMATEEQSGALGKQFTAINTTQTGPFFTLGEELFMKNNGLFSYLAGAVVIAFVVCWLPYHIRRLMFCYVPSSHWTEWVTARGTSSPHARTGCGVRLELGLPGHQQTWGWRRGSGSTGVLHARC